MKKALYVLLLAVLTVLAGAMTLKAGPAKPDPTKPIIAGSTIYIEPMPNGLDGLITAEMIHDKIPLTVTKNKAKADYVMTGESSHRDLKWAEVMFNRTGGPPDIGSINVYKGDTLVWASASNAWSAGMSYTRGMPRVARNVVRKMKGAIAKKGN